MTRNNTLQIGPTVRIEKYYNCKGCQFLEKGEEWVIWGSNEPLDWGTAHSCNAEQDNPRAIPTPNIIGNTVITPHWCPFREENTSHEEFYSTWPSVKKPF